MAAVKDEVKAGGDAAAAEAAKSGDRIGENLADGLTRDSSGRLRDAMGRFASDVEKEVASIGGEGGIKVPLGVDGDPFEHEFRAAMAEAERASQDADQTIVHSFGDVEKASRTVRAAAGELGPTLDGVGRDAEEAGGKLRDAGDKADGAGRGAANGGANFAFLHSRVVMLSAAALALGPALAAIPAAAGAVSLGVGAMAGAFTGVIGALKDYAAQQANSAQSGASAAATAFSNTVSIRNAEQAITDARTQAAQAAQTSKQAVASAAQGVIDAERSAAQAAQSSADAIVAAQQRVAQATYSVGQAQLSETNAEHAALLARQALTQAQADAANQITDLNNAMADSNLQVQQATLNVATAEKAARDARSNSLLTDDQKAQAQLNYQQALQALTDAQQHSVEATQKADQANKQGADGLASVTSAQDAAKQAADAVAAAQHNVTAAVQAQSDAQTALARAQQGAANQQIGSAEQVAKAQQGLVQAQQQAAQQQAASAEQVAKAVQALADMQTQQALAAASAGAANNKFATDMAKLTQPGRDFVNQVLGMKDGLHQLSATAQTATLPGFTQMLKDSQGMFPTINGGIQAMGTAIGGAAIKFGDLMRSPAFQGDMTKILQQAAGFAKDIADGIVGMLGGVAAAAAQAGPIVKALGEGFKGIMQTGIPDFFRGLTVNASGSGMAIQSLLDLVSGLLGPLGTLVGAVSGALGPAFRDLVPHVVDFVDALVKSLLPNMPAFSKALDSVARILGQILVIAEPLLPLIADDLTSGLKVLNPILDALAHLLEDNHGWLGQLAKAVYEMASPIHQLAQSLDWLSDHFGSIRDTVKHWIADVKGWWSDAAAWLDDQWHKIGENASKAWSKVYDYAIKPVKDAVDWITGPSTGFGAVIGFFEHLDIGKSSASHMWDWIKDAFKSAINVVIGWWNDLHFTLPKVSTPLGDIGGGSIGVPAIPYLRAAGGVASGLTGINEQGVELVRLPTGSTVMPHSNTMTALQGGGSVGGTLQIEWVGSAAGDEFMTWLRNNIRIRGGNGPNAVQNVLGQAY